MNRKVEDIVLGSIIGLTAIYVLIRAWKLPLTHDEVSTMYNHVPRRVFDTLTFQREANPNNHILNTLGAKITSGIFGWHQFAARIPVLAGLGFYGYGIFQIVRRLTENSWLRILGILLLLGNPYLLDFFGLSRGYGLANGLMMVAYWQAIQFIDSNDPKNAGGGHIRRAGGLCQFYVFDPFCCTLRPVVHTSDTTKCRQKNAVGYHSAWLKTVGIFALLWYLPLSRLSKDREVVNWEQTGSFMQTFLKLTRSSIHNFSYLGNNTADTLCWLALLGVVVGWILLLIRLQKQKWQFSKDIGTFAVALFGVTVLANFLEVKVSHTTYLQSRLAQFYLPLFALQLFVVVIWLQERFKKFALILIVPVCALLLINNARCLNFTEAYEWYTDSAAFTILDFIKAGYEKEGRTVRYTLNGEHGPMNSVGYYTEHGSIDYGHYVLPQHNGSEADKNNVDLYYSVTDEQKARLESEDFGVWFQVPGTNYKLWRRHYHQ